MLPDLRVAKEESNLIKYDMFEICRYCNEGEDRVQIINAWILGYGFTKYLKFPLSFRNNFYGNKLRMGGDLWEPYLYTTNVDEKGKKMYEGELYRFYLEIGHVLNLTWKFMEATDGTTWSFHSYADDLDQNHIDVIGSGYNCRFDRYERADCSTGELYLEGYSIISVEPSKSLDNKAVFKSFDTSTWLLTFCMIPACGAILYICRKYERDPDRVAEFWDCLWEVIIILLWDVVRIRRASWPVLFICMAHIITSAMLVNLFFSEFTAIIINPKYTTPPINTAEQLWETDYKFVSGYKETTKVILEQFRHIKDIDERHADFTWVKGENPWVEALRKVMSNPKQMVTFNRYDMTYYIKKYNLEGNGSKFYHSKERFQSWYTSLYYKKNCYFQEALNEAILKVKEMGFDKHHESAHRMPYDIKHGLENPEPPASVDYIRLEHLSMVLLLVMGCYVFACLCCLIEVVCKSVKKRWEEYTKMIKEKRKNKPKIIRRKYGVINRIKSLKFRNKTRVRPINKLKVRRKM